MNFPFKKNFFSKKQFCLIFTFKTFFKRFFLEKKVNIFKAFHLTIVMKNRQNVEHRKRSGLLKKLSSDWRKKDQYESAIFVQSLSCTRILFVGKERS